MENIVRENLNAMEEAEAMKRLTVENGYTHAQLAALLGKGRSTVTNALSLVTLPEKIRDVCRGSSRFARRELIKIAAIRDNRKQLVAFRKLEQRLAREESEDPAKPRPWTRSAVAALAARETAKLRRHIETLYVQWSSVAPEERGALLGELCELGAWIARLRNIDGRIDGAFPAPGAQTTGEAPDADG